MCQWYLLFYLSSILQFGHITISTSIHQFIKFNKILKRYFASKCQKWATFLKNVLKTCHLPKSPSSSKIYTTVVLVYAIVTERVQCARHFCREFTLYCSSMKILQNNNKINESYHRFSKKFRYMSASYLECSNSVFVIAINL